MDRNALLVAAATAAEKSEEKDPTGGKALAALIAILQWIWDAIVKLINVIGNFIGMIVEIFTDYKPYANYLGFDDPGLNIIAAVFIIIIILSVVFRLVVNFGPIVLFICAILLIAGFINFLIGV